MKRGWTVLVADDDKYIREDLADLLAGEYTLHFAATAHETRQVVAAERPDLVLLDIKFPDCSDLSLLKDIKHESPATEVIILTSQTENVPQIVGAIKAGAYDYVPKPFVGGELLNRIEKALSLKKLASSEQYLLKEIEQRAGLDQLVGDSPAMRQIREMIQRLADADGCVLIQGESGTGKELAARALHHLSRRRSRPFLAVNCASVPEALVESILFGHRRGAFSGAVESSKGKFETAEDGAIFLDEIGDMPMAQQPSLLRVLEYRRFTPVGEARERECRARFVLATNRNLREMVKEGAFREDLFYRVNVATLSMPALRNRLEDVPALVGYYLRRLSAEMGRQEMRVHPDVIEVLQRYDWPGNVRELKNVLEGSLMLLGPSQQELTLQDLPPELLASRAPAPTAELVSQRERREKEEIVEALRQSGGNQTQASKLLGMHRNTLRTKIRYFGIAKLT